MKKSISWLVIAAFLLTGLGLVAAARADSNQPELEKISSPEHIKEFRVIKKVGNTLYGLRIFAGNVPTTVSGDSANVSASSTLVVSPAGVGQATATLEKIDAPEFIDLYEKIRRVGNALWGIKKNNGDNQSQSGDKQNQSGDKQNQSGDNSAFVAVDPSIAACVASAIAVKDQAVMAEVTAAATDLNTAISARSTCQQAAVSLTSGQGTALQDCANVFTTARQQVNQTASQAQKAAWTVYTASLKTCQQSLSPAAGAATSISATSTSATSTSVSAPSGDNSGNGTLMIQDGGGSTMMNTVLNNGSDN